MMKRLEGTRKTGITRPTLLKLPHAVALGVQSLAFFLLPEIGSLLFFAHQSPRIQTTKNSSHGRAILWRTFREVCGVFWGNVSEAAPQPEITRRNAFSGNFLEVCFGTP